ncbi:Predicted acyl-CoA transferases/carnitine dehydratase [Chromobacterium violaceum]|uniref:Predicted acyl-CoA transferases/carnitine dehydratase n=1 Tax=Chromobacterium violaceum TaxID=536 RepID=A0A3S4HSZ0_CHRVL|nr:Predicted acyl-CoA transferases/carnitine dehydratase [Chromobacterium violaceum]
MDAHPQGRAVAALPPLTITRIGDAPPLPLPPSFRPLQGIRALDLTRIIAGPVAGRALAAHGADVLRITSPNLPTIATLDIDTGRGKRNAGWT